MGMRKYEYIYAKINNTLITVTEVCNGKKIARFKIKLL
jgi:ribosomal protein S11